LNIFWQLQSLGETVSKKTTTQKVATQIFKLKKKIVNYSLSQCDAKIKGIWNLRKFCESAGINLVSELVKILQILSKSPQRQSNAIGLNPPPFSLIMYM